MILIFHYILLLARTLPWSLLLDLCEWYDARFKHCFESILGQAVPSVAWQQACLPASSGGLGLMTDILEMNGGTCHKSDLAFLVACRAIRSAVDALLRSERDFVSLGYEVARDKLMLHLPNHMAVLQEYREPIAQKDILPTFFEAARRHLVSQVCLGSTARLLILVPPMLYSLMLFLWDCRCSRPNVCSVPSDVGYLCASCRHLPYRGGKSPIAQSNPRYFSIICQIRRLGLVLNRRAFCQRSRGVDRLMSYLCQLPCIDNPNGLCIPIYLWISRLFRGYFFFQGWGISGCCRKSPGNYEFLYSSQTFSSYYSRAMSSPRHWI